MSDFAVKQSQQGKNVLTCEDKELVFSGDWNTHKIIEKKYKELTVNNGANGSYSFTHSYGMIAALVYIDLVDNKYSFADATGRVSSGNYNYSYVEISNNQVKVDIYNRGGANKTFHIYCFLLREQS